MANKEMKKLNLNGNTYEIVDEAARASLSSHTHSTLNGPDGSELLYCYSSDGDTKTLFQTKSNSGDYSYCQFGNNTFYTGEGYRVYDENYKPALTDLSGTLAVANGGTGASTAAQARHNIGADHAYNLLVNSNFADPVNRQGKTSYSGGEDAIDGWKMQFGTNMNLMDGFIRITGDWDARQFLGGKLIGTYTFAVYAKVNVVGEYKQTIELFENDSPIASCMCTSVGEWKIYTCTATFTGANNIVNPMVIINNRAGSVSDASFDVKWAALYEGAYTADTLPAYVPYPKQVEMIRCGVSLTPHNLLDNSDFRNPVNQRGITESSENGYFIDRWGNYNGTSKVVSSGIQVNANKGSSAFLYQYINVLRDGTYTFAAKVNGNIVLRVIQISGTTVTTIDGNKAGYTGGYLSVLYANDNRFEFDFRVESGATITVEWAALYEGSYTADTLPAYVPKGYAAELAECQRYYYRMTSPGLGVFGIGTISGVSTTDNTMNCYVQINYAKNMRTWPGVWLSDFTKFKIGDFVTSVTLTSDVSMVAYSHATGSVFLKFSDAPRGSFGSAGKIVYLYDTNNSNAYIEFSADL